MTGLCDARWPWQPRSLWTVAGWAVWSNLGLITLCVGLVLLEEFVTPLVAARPFAMVLPAMHLLFSAPCVGFAFATHHAPKRRFWRRAAAAGAVYFGISAAFAAACVLAMTQLMIRFGWMV